LTFGVGFARPNYRS